jgi:chaperonin GroEL
MSYKQHNEVYFNNDALEKLREGLELCYNAVKVTLGGRGRNVTIHHYNHNQYEKSYAIQNTKDGVTVIKSLFTNIPEMNIGIDLMKQTCDKTVKNVGDGTTGTVVYTYHLFNEAFNRLRNNNRNVYNVKKGIEIGLSEILKELDNNSIQIKNLDDLYNIAMISSNGDAEVSKLISDIIWKYKKDCNINIKRSPIDRLFIEENHGMVVDRGYYSPALLDKKSDKYKELSNCRILLTDEEITHTSQIKDILNFVITNKESLLIIAKDFKGDILSTIMANKELGNLANVMLVKAPDFDHRSYEKLKDVASALNCRVISKYEGSSLNDVVRELNTINATNTKENKLNKLLGKSDKVIISIDKTVISINENEKSIEERIKDIEGEINKEQEIWTVDKDWVIEGLHKRISNLKGAITTIYVNGNSDLEINEKIDRIDDCINSVKCALEEGYVAGGGLTLYNISNNMTTQFNNDDIQCGYNIIKEVIKEPMEVIISNAVTEFDYKTHIEPNISNSIGYNVVSEQLENFIETGIIDAVKVIKASLTNAVSTASILITTNCVIVNSFVP